MILSVSRRTDIPAFFPDWFFSRIAKGFAYVRNPMNLHQVSKVPITPEAVDCIVFWTRNPKYFAERLHLLKPYNYYFLFTITGYGKELEPNVPSLQDSIQSFINLSEQIGSKRVIWRYDPIIMTNELDLKFHSRNFELIAQQLSGHTQKCIISFVHYYKKTVRNLSQVNYFEISNTQKIELARHLAAIGKRFSIDITSCAEETDFSEHGITPGKCIDLKLIEETFGISLKINKDKNQRAQCGCVESIDIGAYHSCPHGCLYCYANYDMKQVHQNYALHDAGADLLYGTISREDKITERKVSNCKITQQSLFNKLL